MFRRLQLNSGRKKKKVILKGYKPKMTARQAESIYRGRTQGLKKIFFSPFKKYDWGKIWIGPL